MEVVARLEQVTKAYGRTVALDAVSVVVPPGVTAVLGPNGAGKSTMVSILAGLRRPGGGRVEVLGGDPRSVEIRRRLGLTPQQTALPWRLTVAETLALIAAHYPGGPAPSKVVERMALGELLTRRNGSLSGGERRRVALATALVNDPDLVFLDEPTTGLDADSRDRLWETIVDTAAAGRAVVLTTHDMAEAERLAQHVVVIHAGRVARTGSVDEVCAEVGVHLVEFDLPGGIGPDPLPAPVERIETLADRVRAYTKDPDAVVRALVHSGVRFRGIRVGRVGLEEAIRTLLRPEPPDEPEPPGESGPPDEPGREPDSTTGPLPAKYQTLNRVA